MKLNITIGSKENIRLISSITLFVIIDSVIFYLFNVKGWFIVAAIVIIILQLTFCLNYSSVAPKDNFTIDLRTQYQKDNDEYNRVINLIEGKRNNLIANRIEGHISKEQLDEGIELLEDLLINKQKLLS